MQRNRFLAPTRALVRTRARLRVLRNDSPEVFCGLHNDSPADWASGEPRHGIVLCRRGSLGKSDLDGQSAAFGVVGSHIAVMQPDGALRDGQTKPDASGAALAGDIE